MASTEVETRVERQIAKAGIPSHCHAGILGYVLYGHEFGDFLWAVFQCERFDVVALLADDVNKLHLQDYARLLHMLPRGCWGSASNVEAWIRKGGLSGTEETRESHGPDSEVVER